MREKDFEELVAGVREGASILREETKPSRMFTMEAPNVKEIRSRFSMSQREFAKLLGISIKTLQNWEQGRRKPRGSSRVLLQVASRHPDIVWSVVKGDSPIRKNAQEV